MPEEKKISVVVFEDNQDLRESLCILLKGISGIELLDSFQNCNTVERNIERLQPDLVLMDIDMPGMNGTDGVKIIKRLLPLTQVLMLTVFEDNENIFRSICAGASGYLVKGTPPDRIVSAIFEVMQGGAPMTPKIARQVLELFPKNISARSEDSSLSAREREVLALLVKGYSYKMIASDLQISFDTVRSHIRKIYEKLHVHSNTEAVMKAINQRIV